MSAFLEILRCVLCCVEDNPGEHDNEPLYRNTSWETRETLIDAPPKFNIIFNSEPNYSANARSAYAKSVYDVVSSSTNYVPISSCSQPSSSSRLPKPSERLASSSNPTPLRPKPPKSFSNQSQSPLVPKGPSTNPSLLSPTLPPPSSNPSPQTASPCLHSSPSILKIPISYSKSSPSFPTPAAASYKPVNVSHKAPPSSSRPSPSASKVLPSFKQTLAPASSNLTDTQEKTNSIWVQKDVTPIYAIPKDIQDLIKRDKVPDVLKKPLSLSTYKDYFAALLYAEDYYIEKWSKFELVGITLNLQEAAILKRPGFGNSYEKDDRNFVEFEIPSSRKERPFLLSRDFVFARPSGSKTEKFQGIINRVKRSTTVLVEFDEDFHAQHYSSRKYDVSFSFNRVCLKRAHQAIEAASDPSFSSFIFPGWGFRKFSPPSSPNLDYSNKLDLNQNSAVQRIITIQELPPYLLDGPLCVAKVKVREKEYKICNSKQLSRTGLVIQQAVLGIYRRSQKHRILICAPINSTCDVLMTSLKEIPESEMFRANAAFREIDGVPTDILASSLYRGECFACPPLQELRKFKVILSTYVSSFRLHNEGIAAGHFSHIFIVDASSATEPEAMVALANLANENTAVIVTGSLGNYPGWVRSDIARKNGLMTSYFERLLERTPYNNLNPNFVTKLAN